MRVLDSIACSGEHNDATAVGAAAFECGSTVRFSIDIEEASKTIRRISYSSNGCGFTVAAAEAIAAETRGKSLTELHGSQDLEDMVADALGDICPNRRHCIDLSASAFRLALSNFRQRSVDEFQGETALICTCFGISEETVLEVIERTSAVDTAQVSAACRAGSGCGSCRMLIQELIDASLSKDI